VKVLGLIQLVDAGEQDDKLIAVTLDSPFAKAESVSELDQLFPGVTAILHTWFENYKGKGALQCSGFGGPEQAQALLTKAIESFTAAERGGR
jgi:inorganic pyrophosphatase